MNGQWAAIIVILAIVACSAAIPAHAQGAQGPVSGMVDDSNNGRTSQPRSGSGKMFAPIGIVVPNNMISIDPNGKIMTSQVRATGFLVSPCFVLTVSHIVFGIGIPPDSDMKKYSVSFYVGEDLATGFRYKVRGVPVAHGDYSRSPAEDWALIKLDKCAGANMDIGWIEISPIDWAEHPDGKLFPDEKLFLAGYPVDRTGKLLWLSNPCHISGQAAVGAATHHCHEGPGDSGAPIIAIRGPNNIVALAMNQGIDGVYPVAVDLDYIATHPAWKLVEDDISSWNIINPSKSN